MAVGKKKTNYFFDQFEVCGQMCVKAMETLMDGVKNFDPDHVEDLKNAVHQIEHEADTIKNETEERLAKEFMTPIDREDIFLLLDAIDDLTDSIDDIAYKLFVRRYHNIPEHSAEFMEIAYQSVLAVNEVIKNLSNVANKKLMSPLIAKVKELEEQADRLQSDAIRELYKDYSAETYPSIKLAETVYGHLEFVTDKCRAITKEVEIIMYKNL